MQKNLKPGARGKIHGFGVPGAIIESNGPHASSYFRGVSILDEGTRFTVISRVISRGAGVRRTWLYILVDGTLKAGWVDINNAVSI